MGKVEDVGGVVTQGVGVGKKIFGRLWRPKIYPHGDGARGGGFKKISLTRGVLY